MNKTNYMDLMAVSGPGFVKRSRIYYLSILVIYLIVLTIIYFYDPWNIVTKYIDYSLIISIVFGFFLCVFLNFYSYEFTDEDEISIKTNMSTNFIGTFVRMFVIIIGLGISAGFMYWLIKSFGTITNENDYIKVILNVLIVLFILTLVYKFFNVGNYISNIPILRLIINTLLYIPCLFSDFLEIIFGKETKKTELFDTTYIYLLFGIIILYIIYFLLYPFYKKSSKLQGGKQVLNKPLTIHNESNIMSYRELNDMIENEEGYDYQYGMSTWFYIDSEPPSTNSSYTKYTSIMNYGNKPNILYKADTNSLIVVVELKTITPEMLKNNQFELFDDNKRIVYKTDNVLLQKWNNLIINYSAGTLDIFLNGELVKSSINVVPYMAYDMLTVGENNGLYGNICNIVYFKKPLDINQIHNLYDKNKNNTPPIL